MTHTEAQQLLGVLVGATTGWTNAADETFVSYTNAIAGLDLDVATFTVDRIVRTWDEPRRPPIATILAAYRSEMRRLELERPTLEAAVGLPVSVGEGRRIAARAYQAECQRRGREPNERVMDRMLGLIGNDDT